MDSENEHSHSDHNHHHVEDAEDSLPHIFERQPIQHSTPPRQISKKTIIWTVVVAIFIIWGLFVDHQSSLGHQQQIQQQSPQVYSN